GVLSAQGMLASEPGRDLSSAVLKDISVLNDEALQEYFDSLKADATGQLEQENVDISTLKFRQRMELRYKGQSSGFLIDFVGGGNHAEKFHKAHLAASGHCLELEIELVNVRLAARVTAAMTRLEETTPPAVLVEAQMIYMADMKSLIAVYDRDSMLPGESLEGPAIISEAGSTVWLAPGWTARPDRWGNLVLEVA
ncbi:MAG: N-methylhydantoinase A, partial [Rhodothermales bacterium]